MNHPNLSAYFSESGTKKPSHHDRQPDSIWFKQLKPDPVSYFVKKSHFNKYIIENIERAYSLAPLLPLPYDSYCEICRLDGKKPTLPETTVRMVDECEPGYRRGLVKDTIDKITITIPGTY